jgi:hypothetical protein
VLVLVGIEEAKPVPLLHTENLTVPATLSICESCHDVFIVVVPSSETSTPLLVIYTHMKTEITVDVLAGDSFVLRFVCVTRH